MATLRPSHVLLSLAQKGVSLSKACYKVFIEPEASKVCLNL